MTRVDGGSRPGDDVRLAALPGRPRRRSDKPAASCSVALPAGAATTRDALVLHALGAGHERGAPCGNRVRGLRRRGPRRRATCVSRSVTPPAATRRHRSRSPMRRTGAASTSCGRWRTHGASRCSVTGPARRCGSPCGWPPRTVRRPARLPAAPAPDRRSCADDALPEATTAVAAAACARARRCPSRASARCSTACRTPSSPPTSTARSVTPTLRPRGSWAGPTGRSPAVPPSIWCPTHCAATGSSRDSKRSSTTRPKLSSAGACRRSSSAPTGPRSTPSWCSACSTTRSPEG